MAGTPGAVARLFEQIWEPAKAKAAEERDALVALARAEGVTHAIEPWDWRYFAEKVRKARYRLDDAEVAGLGRREPNFRSRNDASSTACPPNSKRWSASSTNSPRA